MVLGVMSTEQEMALNYSGDKMSVYFITACLVFLILTQSTHTSTTQGRSNFCKISCCWINYKVSLLQCDRPHQGGPTPSVLQPCPLLLPPTRGRDVIIKYICDDHMMINNDDRYVETETRLSSASSKSAFELAARTMSSLSRQSSIMSSSSSVTSVTSPLLSPSSR